MERKVVGTMGADLPSAPSRSDDDTTRRRLLTLMGVGGAAAVASVVTAKEAKAGHDGSNTFHLGEENVAPGNPMRTTALRGNGATPVLDVSNEGDAAASSAINASTQAPTGAAITAFGESWGVVGHGDDAGVQGFSFSGTGSGLAGHSDGAGTGVSGVTNTGIGVSGGSGSGTGTGVSGMADTGTGVHGHASSAGTGVLGESLTGVGVQGQSDTGVGGVFSSNSGKGLQVDGPASISANVPADSGDALFVENQHEGAEGVWAGGGISATSQGGHGVEGLSSPNEFLGPDGDPQLGIGVRGVAMSAEGGWDGPGDGVHGQSGSGTGVLGISESGTAVEARSGTEGDGTGIALLVRGKSVFTTAGSAVIPAGDNSVFVANSDVTGDSHISVTLAGDPGPRNLAWVQRDPGNGFTVHLTSAPPPKRPATPFTYLIVEPG
ncbi:MAG: hypothetical protein ACRDLB_03540 [Actinomycetota bacterium]